MKSQPQEHWTRIYDENAPSVFSWHQTEPAPSLSILDRFCAAPESAFIDIGGGASNLVDSLLLRAWTDVTVLDIAAPALEATKERLGRDASKVHWEVADITQWQPARRYDLWHDRAVFHFLTEPEQQDAYRRAMLAGVAAGGLVIMATFALDGPDKCSGQPVQRFDPASLARTLGGAFQILDTRHEEHVTPRGSSQSFNWCVFRRSD